MWTWYCLACINLNFLLLNCTEREREGGREKKKEKDRQRDRQSQRERERNRQRVYVWVYRERDRHTDRVREREEGIEKEYVFVGVHTCISRISIYMQSIFRAFRFNIKVWIFCKFPNTVMVHQFYSKVSVAIICQSMDV